MATITQCDGCGQPIVGEVRELGLVLRREYCEACHGTAKQFLDEQDALHDRLAKAWMDDLTTLRETYRTKLAQLPDDNFTPLETPA